MRLGVKMDLKNLSDESLLLGAKRLAREEREILTAILHHLREIDRRRLFSDLKYKSLHDYAVGELKYSDAQAGRRIAAMRLLRDLPEIEEKITDGSLSLSNLVLAQTLFLKERKAGRPTNVEGKREVLFRLENQSTRAAEKLVAEINPEMAYRNNLNFDSIKEDSLRDKLLAIKGRLAHSRPNITLEELLHVLADNELERLNREPGLKKANGNVEVKSKAKTEIATAAKESSAPKVTSKAGMIREVKLRDQQKCTNCSSTHALQIDHIRPKAAGGPDVPQNLRVLCRKCNQRAAIKYFGMKMATRYFAGQ